MRVDVFAGCLTNCDTCTASNGVVKCTACKDRYSLAVDGSACTSEYLTSFRKRPSLQGLLYPLALEISISSSQSI
jgi:hypothetical protein